MNTKKIIISGVGCGIADLIYNGVSFNTPNFKKYLTQKIGDGGLSPGKLVFTEKLAVFSISSGGNCCFTVGGTYLETTPGEIKLQIQTAQKAYIKQIKTDSEFKISKRRKNE